ncbi:MAG: PorT family protein [Bacteroidetes bacterium]|nr:PorT family protein [Bacteroidota bacterium]
MKKFYLTNLVLLLFVISSYSQLFTIGNFGIGYLDLGLKAGTTISSIKRQLPSGINQKVKMGFQIGAVGNFGITEKLSIQSELIYSQKGDVIDAFGTETKTKENFFGIPILAKFKFIQIGKMKFYANGGTYTNILVGGKVIYSNGEEFHLEDSRYKTVDFGLNIGAGFQYDLDNGDLLFDLRYDFGVVDSDKIDPERNTNKSLGITLTYIYDINDIIAFSKKHIFKKSNNKNDDAGVELDGVKKVNEE